MVQKYCFFFKCASIRIIFSGLFVYIHFFLYLCERLHFVLPAFHVVGVVDVVDEITIKRLPNPRARRPRPQ